MRRNQEVERESDDELGAMLQEHFAAELDPHVGRARRAFEAHVLRETSASPRRPSRRGTFGTWLFRTAGPAAAAGLAAFFVVQQVARHRQPTVIGTNVTPTNYHPSTNVSPTVAITTPADTSPQWEEVRKVVCSGAQDNGLVVLDNKTPARVVRRVSMERTEWLDPKRNVRVEVEVPREKVMLIGMDPY
jgi:hypothetical protein